MVNQEKTNPMTDTYSTAVDWSDSLFDQVVDPFEQIAASERRNGQVAGRRAGYLEGRDIGRSKGWEIGLELGYIHSFASGLLDGCQEHTQQANVHTDSDESLPTDRSNKRLDRCLAISRELIDMVNQFPDPDTLLQNYDMDNIRSTKKNGEEGVSPDQESLCSDDEKRTSKESEMSVHVSSADVTFSLQRIRAKFKLLLVLLKAKCPLDLKRLLNTNNSSDQTESRNVDNNQIAEKADMQSTQKDSDW
jgi:hypothetical protein